MFAHLLFDMPTRQKIDEIWFDERRLAIDHNGRISPNRHIKFKTVVFSIDIHGPLGVGMEKTAREKFYGAVVNHGKIE